MSAKAPGRRAMARVTAAAALLALCGTAGADLQTDLVALSGTPAA